MKPSFLWLSPTLTRLGKKFGIDAHYFAKNSSLVFLGQVVSFLRGIVGGYLVVRFFPQMVYGEYQFILSVVGMLSLFGLPGLGNPVARAWARNEGFSLWEVTKRQLTFCLIGSAILLGCIPFLEHYNRQELWPLFLAAAILFPLPPIAMVYFGGYTIGKGRFDMALKATIAWSILMILATLPVIFFRQSALLMLLISMSIPSLVYFYMSRKFRPPAEKEGSENTKAILRYGWQLTFATLPIDLVWYIDKLLISHFFGLAQLATFSVALLIPEQAKIFMKQFIPVSFAKQAMGEDSRQRRVRLMKAVLIGSAVFAAGIAFYIALTPWIIPLLFPQYDAREVILLTSIAAISLITMPGALFMQYLEAHAMIREIKLSNWGAAIIFCISLFVLIPFYGLLGAVIARGLFRFVYWGATWFFVLRAPILNIRTQNDGVS